MLKKILPHICIDLAIIFLVLWVIDRVNSAMNMLGRDVFKIPFGIFLVLVIALGVICVVDQRRE